MGIKDNYAGDYNSEYWTTVIEDASTNKIQVIPTPSVKVSSDNYYINYSNSLETNNANIISLDKTKIKKEIDKFHERLSKEFEELYCLDQCVCRPCDKSSSDCLLNRVIKSINIKDIIENLRIVYG